MYILLKDKLILDDIRNQLARLLGRPLNQTDFAELLAKHGERIRDLIVENEEVE